MEDGLGDKVQMLGCYWLFKSFLFCFVYGGLVVKSLRRGRGFLRVIFLGSFFRFFKSFESVYVVRLLRGEENECGRISIELRVNYVCGNVLVML